MGRRKSSSKPAPGPPVTTLVPHSTANLGELLERALRGASGRHVTAYLARGGLVDARGRTGISENTTLLQAAVYYDVEASVQLLLSAGADVNLEYKHISEDDVGTALDLACASPARLPILKMLLDAKADMYKASATGWTCLGVAIAGAEVGAVKELLARGYPIERPDVREGQIIRPLYSAAFHKHIETVKLLLEEGADVNALSVDIVEGRTALHAAAGVGSLPILRLLLNAGALINAKDVDGFTPLHCAVADGHDDAAVFLISEGADINAVTVQDVTVVHSAVTRSCSASTLQLLHKAGAHIDQRDAKGVTPYQYAARYGCLEHVQYLVDNGADATSKDKDGTNALMCAALRGHTDVVKHLLTHTAIDVNEANQRDKTALMCGSQEGHISVVQLLLDAGADVHLFDRVGESALQHAARNAHCDTISLLLQHGADVNALADGRTGCTPIMCCKDSASLRLLIKAGADVHKMTANGDNCLHVAAVNGYPANIICLLITAGADPTAQNTYRMTPAQTAHAEGHAMAEMLLARAAKDYKKLPKVET